MEILRKATKSDIDDIMNIEKEAFAEGIQESKDIFLERIETFSEGFFILEENNKKIGYFSSELWNSVPQKGDSCFSLNHSALKNHKKEGAVLYISSIAILNEYKGNGLGYRFFNKSVEKIIKSFPQIKEIVLLVNEIWIPALHIYKKCGFIEYGRIQKFFSSNETKTDGILMRKTVER
ncbi:MAG: GNAT family N-acetyltransferase [Spirochaetales bacterium]|nr:GNAT family N-acetyltransferase [Spirochaetales bacterium]